MNQFDIEGCLSRALDALFVNDWYLLDIDANERSISHCLAVHLMNQIHGYDIDCEYNRDGFDVKRLELPERSINPTDIDVNAVTVYPDIVVHRRGNSDNNLLVIEMKKVSSNEKPDYDIRKLKAFRKELKYAFAVHVIVGKNSANDPIKKIEWVIG